jgi:hypothetical protein
MAFTLQLVDGTGAFNDTGLEELVRRVQLEKHGVSFKVVGIMGAQSSGKSMLLNALFDTSFRVMDASKGRSQTTQGVWLAKAEKMTRCTLVMDLEGSDGAERGEDGTLFEKQIALFALAVTDILLINLWYNDIGREKAAGKPLLRAIFDVMRRIFGARKMTLMFVIRDMSRHTPIEIMESDLLTDLQKIWDEASESGKHTRSPVQEFFDVIVTSLPNYEERSDAFAEQVTHLRKRFENLAEDYKRTEPGTLFSHSTKEIWRSIQENKVLDIPTHRFLVSAFRCDEIAIMSLLSQEGDTNNAIEGFREVVDAKVTKCLDEFMAETELMREECRTSKRNDLICEVSKVLWPVYFRQIERHQSQALSEFRRGFDQRIRSGGRMRDFVHTAQEAALHSFDRSYEGVQWRSPLQLMSFVFVIISFAF